MTMLKPNKLPNKEELMEALFDSFLFAVMFDGHCDGETCLWLMKSKDDLRTTWPFTRETKKKAVEQWKKFLTNHHRIRLKLKA